ncbi:MAG: hypothetical protein JKY50_07230 [Oleispira sp.]|nr:hypothetical protein [Oleispira sp.]
MLNLKQPNRFNAKKIAYHGLAIGGISLLVACGGNSSSNKNTTIPDQELTPPAQVNNCFWGDPYSIANPASNFAYPDTGATYWHAKYILPEGANLKLTGQYPYARYMSFNSYRNDATPAFALMDQDIAADTGSINPFTAGAERNNENRDYQIQLQAGEAPQSPLDNTLYDYAQTDDQSIGQTTLLYRVYVPNTGQDITGGTDLPQAELTLNNGEVLTGQAACDSLQSDQTMVSIPFIPADTYANLRQNSSANANPIWRAAYNVQFNLRCVFLGMCAGEPERQVGWYANLDNQYLSTNLDRSIKPIAVIRGKIPNVPATLAGNETFDESQAQLRYWSLCQNEYYSQKVTGCLHDEQVTINPDGYFTIVTSLESERPSNATDACGIGYLPWSAKGDGFSIIPDRLNHENDALLILRNMLPVNGFAKTAQNTTTPGDESAVLAEFMPTVQYFTQAEFEALGCDAYTSMPQ